MALSLKEGGHNVYFVMRSVIYPLAGRTPLRAQPPFCGKDRGHTICYLSALTSSIPGPVGGPLGVSKWTEKWEMRAWEEVWYGGLGSHRGPQDRELGGCL